MQQSQPKEPNGVLIVNKHAGVTSHDIVNKIRRLFATRQVGHTGTLDPMATGVLVVLVGRAVKASEYLTYHTKRYRAGLRLGITTDTEDSTGRVLSSSDRIPSHEDFSHVLESFRGEILQTPPMYSALKVEGQKLVDLARQGKTVERTPRPVTIHSLGILEHPDPSDYLFDVSCSGGTYIRTLCADIGRACGCGGIMTSLERLAVGDYRLEDAHSMEELEALSYEERLNLLLPVESLFAGLPSLHLEDFYEQLCKNGCEIYQQKIGTSFPVGQRVRLLDRDNRFYALGEVREYPDGTAVKSIKKFIL